jgi:16S rRNA (guanine527-N7)-methyltransferase
MQLNGIRVSRETVERLERFEALFQKWANTINLVAPSTKADFWKRHIADSAQIFQLSPAPATWVDLGSGGGFPGIITAIFLAELGDGWVHLVESNQKKASFLRTAIAETGARASVHPVRIEAAPAAIPRCDRISARALAELPLLLDYASGWMLTNPEIKAFLHKGRDYAAEVDKAHGRWNFDLVQHASVVEDDSVILEVSRLQRKV